MFPPFQGYEIALGTFHSISSAKCIKHLPIIAPALKLADQHNCKFISLRCQEHGTLEFFVSKELSGDAKGKITSITRPPPIGPKGEVARTESERVHHDREDIGGKFTDPSWVDLDQVKHWKTTCESYHTECCHNPLQVSIPPARPHWFIDTFRMSLVPATSAHGYVALSYVWGLLPALKTTKSNLDEYRKPGSFAVPKTYKKIPKTIRDAIHVTRTLEVKFLWVDALCIVQDDEENLTDQINNMASIYAYASLTIVAAQGDTSRHGLLGLRGCSKALGRHQASTRLFYERITADTKHDYIVVETRDGPSIIAQSPWKQRAWTFQESIFSDRKLYFTPKGVFWKCSSWSWQEDLAIQHPIRPKFDVHQIIPYTQSWPDFHHYIQLVNTFKGMKTSFPKDRLAAFNGITTALENNFLGGFVFGLSELFLDSFML